MTDITVGALTCDDRQCSASGDEWDMNGRTAKTRRVLRDKAGASGTLRIAAVIGLLVLLAVGPAGAETPDDESEDTEAGAVLPDGNRRALEKIDETLRRLQRQRERLDELKRTEHPFHSERKLRHQMRRNEAEQRWLKHERERLEHERRREQQRERARP